MLYPLGYEGEARSLANRSGCKDVPNLGKHFPFAGESVVWLVLSR